MNFGKLIFAGMILVVVLGLVVSFSEFQDNSTDKESPSPISYTVCPFVHPANVETWVEEADGPESLAAVLMESFNASLDPNYPITVVRKLAEDGEVERVYLRYAYSFANCSKTISSSSGWRMEEHYLAVPPIREMTQHTKEFDILYGMIYTEMNGKGIVFLYYLSNPKTIDNVEGISLFYPKNLSIVETIGEIAWKCWHRIENGDEIGSCEENGTKTFPSTIIDNKNSAGFLAEGPYGSIVVVFNGTVKEEENLPISMRVAVVVDGEGRDLPLGWP